MKKSSNIIYFLYAGLLLLIIGCDDVFEEDIEDEMVTIISPDDLTTIESNAVEFRWNEIEGAKGYRIQVTRVETQRNVLDSLVEGDRFAYGLDPGVYRWQMRAENFAYETPYTAARTFTLETSDNLENQEVFLNSPSDGHATNGGSILLTWNRILAADRYVLEVDRSRQNNTETIINEENITRTSYTLDGANFEQEGIYTWRVKAVNETTNTETLFKSRTILLDKQDPNRPTLSSPNADASLTNRTVNFSWSLGTDTGEVTTPLRSTIQISSDQNFASGSIIRSETIDDVSYEFTFTSGGEYYWRIIAVDAATNDTESEIRKVTIQ